jgi:photosystem II stability/assembly factor-like uncharacterized protein
LERISSSTRAINLNGAGKDGFTEGNPLGPIPPTNFNARWCNGVQEELANVIESEGLVPTDSSRTQVLDAIEIKRAQDRMTASLATWVPSTVAGGYAGTLLAVVYANNQWVVVGSSGGLQTSPDGIRWTQRTFASSYTNTAYGIAWTGSSYVACGAAAMLQTSADGITWTTRTPGSAYAGNFFSVCHGGSLAVACGSSCEIQTSPTGVTWTRRTAPWADANPLNEAIYTPYGTWFVVGHDSRIASSVDGVSWIQRAAGGGTALNSIAANPSGIMVAVGDNGYIVRSTNSGQTWFIITPFTSAALYNVQWNGVCFIASGDNNTGGYAPFWVSLDGLSWSPIYWNTSNATIRATYNGQNTTVAVGSGTYQVARSGQVVGL